MLNQLSLEPDSIPDKFRHQNFNKCQKTTEGSGTSEFTWDATMNSGEKDDQSGHTKTSTQDGMQVESKPVQEMLSWEATFGDDDDY